MLLAFLVLRPIGFATLSEADGFVAWAADSLCLRNKSDAEDS
jgi:hypothetical protein